MTRHLQAMAKPTINGSAASRFVAAVRQARLAIRLRRLRSAGSARESLGRARLKWAPPNQKMKQRHLRNNLAR